MNLENTTVLVVSHDRHFLNKVCTHIADIDYGKIKMFVGNYDFWYESNQLMQDLIRNQNKKLEQKRKELQDFIARFSANASKSKQATSRKKQLEKLQFEDMQVSNRKYPYIEFKPEREAGNNMLKVENLSKTIDGEKVLNNISFTVNTGDKVSIVLTAKASDGVVWYKIKQGNGFGYICSKFVKVDDSKAPSSNTKQTTSTSSTTNTDVVFGTLNQSASYRMGPSDIFKEAGTLTSGQNVTIISSVKNIDNSNWYKIAVSGKVYYIPSSYVTSSGKVKDGEASVSGKVHDYLNYRSSYDITNKPVGTFPKNTDVVITGAINSGNYNWYRVQYNGKIYYAAANWITVSDQKYDGKEATPVSDTQSVEVPAGGIESLKGVGRFTASGTYIPKDGSTWFNASSQVVGYYMDPRNFINENNIYMFEDLSYQSYQSQAAVSKIISGTALERNGFMASWFVSAGKENGMSPIALAARARQETGGGSIAISGYIFPDGKYAYNPYNIGAYSNANPVMRGLEYAKKQGWDTKQKAVFGGAKFIASGYIKQGQNSVYFQRFNVANGAAKVGTHQYMTNISACYTESISTKNSYSAYGITNESLVFVIPVYTNMPASTALPH